jgi:hypothetical protein
MCEEVVGHCALFSVYLAVSVYDFPDCTLLSTFEHFQSVKERWFFSVCGVLGSCFQHCFFPSTGV